MRISTWAKWALTVGIALAAFGCTTNMTSTATGQGRSGFYMHLQAGLEQSGYDGQAEGANATNTGSIVITSPLVK